MSSFSIPSTTNPATPERVEARVYDFAVVARPTGALQGCVNVLFLESHVEKFSNKYVYGAAAAAQFASQLAQKTSKGMVHVLPVYDAEQIARIVERVDQSHYMVRAVVADLKPEWKDQKSFYFVTLKEEPAPEPASGKTEVIGLFKIIIGGLACLTIIVLVLLGIHANDYLKVEQLPETTDQTLLVKYALKAKHLEVRCAAVAKLTDQALLEKIFQENVDNAHRRAVIVGLTNQAALAKIALTTDYTGIAECDYEVYRADAIKKLTDQDLLMNIYQKNGYKYFNFAVIEGLTNQAALAKIALAGDEDYSVRQAAIKKITDQVMLMNLIKDETADTNVRGAAFDCITDQAVLAKIALDSTCKVYCAYAIRKLTDQAVLAKIAQEDRQDGCRTAEEAKDRLHTLTFNQIRY